jgi:hypothetical protein
MGAMMKLPQKVIDEIRSRINNAGRDHGFEFASTELFDHDRRLEIEVKPLPEGRVQKTHVVGARFFGGHKYQEISAAQFYGVVDDMARALGDWYEVQAKKVA